jgi:photosystem II stability/assembly factor-like uncharacterized protein
VRLTGKPRFFSSTTGEFEVSADHAVIYVTLDAGTTWSPRAAPGSGTAFFPDGNTGWLNSSDGATLYRTSDGGRVWSAHHPATNLSPVVDVQFVTRDQDYAILATSSGLPVLMKTTDSGLTWNQVPIAVS